MTAIQLPADIEAHIRQKVDQGDYPSVDEVIREALRLLDAQERQLASLRAKLLVGIEQLDRGEGIPYNADLVSQIRLEAEERSLRGEQPSPDVTP